MKNEQLVVATAETFSYDLLPEDEFLVLGCDGMWEQSSPQEVVNFIRERIRSCDCVPVRESLKSFMKRASYMTGPHDKGVSLSAIAAEMLDKLVAPEIFNGTGLGCDNMTCVIVSLRAVSPS